MGADSQYNRISDTECLVILTLSTDNTNNSDIIISLSGALFISPSTYMDETFSNKIIIGNHFERCTFNDCVLTTTNHIEISSCIFNTSLINYLYEYLNGCEFNSCGVITVELMENGSVESSTLIMSDENTAALPYVKGITFLGTINLYGTENESLIETDRCYVNTVFATNSIINIYSGVYRELYFEDYSTTLLTIYGGYFTFILSEWVAPGYTIVETTYGLLHVIPET